MILITGATGFTGSYVLYELLKKGVPVRALKRSSSSFKETELIFRYLLEFSDISSSVTDLLQRVEWVEGDLGDELSLDAAMEGISEIYHCAAIVSFEGSSRNDLLKINVEGTARLVNLAIEYGVKKFGYISSTAALSRNEKGIIDESISPEVPSFSSFYSKSKYYAEMEVWRGMAEGLPAVIVNPGIILGWGNFNKGSIKIFRTVYKGLPFYPPGSNGYVDARDVARALTLLMENDNTFGKRYPLVSQSISYRDLFTQIAARLGVAPPGRKAGAFLSHGYGLISRFGALMRGKTPTLTKDMVETALKSYSFSGSLIREALNFEYIPLETTIKDVCKVFLSEAGQQ